MNKITVLLPWDDTEKHIDAICEDSDFEIGAHGGWLGPHRTVFPIEVMLKQPERKSKGTRSKEKPPIGHFMILPARDNAIIMFGDHEVNTEKFAEFVQLIRKHFQDLNFLIETRAEPWRRSPVEKRERDKSIWENRNPGETWERTAELAGCGVTTAKERYLYMQRSLDDD